MADSESTTTTSTTGATGSCEKDADQFECSTKLSDFLKLYNEIELYEATLTNDEKEQQAYIEMSTLKACDAAKARTGSGTKAQSASNVIVHFDTETYVDDPQGYFDDDFSVSSSTEMSLLSSKLQGGGGGGEGGEVSTTLQNETVVVVETEHEKEKHEKEKRQVGVIPQQKEDSPPLPFQEEYQQQQQLLQNLRTREEADRETSETGVDYSYLEYMRRHCKFSPEVAVACFFVMIVVCLVLYALINFYLKIIEPCDISPSFTTTSHHSSDDQWLTLEK